MVNWDTNQNNIFQNVSKGDGHTIVSAVPGSGKTTTLCESLKHIPSKREEVFFTSFNSKIISEIKNRIPEDIESGTNHKLGFQTVLQNWGSTYRLPKNCVDSKGNIAYLLATKEVGVTGNESLKMNLIKAMDFAKISLSNTPGEILNQCYHYGIDFNGWDEDRFVDSVSSMMKSTAREPIKYKNKRQISFADMIWLPYVNAWKPKQYDRIFIDEAQDLSPARTKLLLSALKSGGRILACGDRFQSIFSFAGADSDSIDKLKGTLTANEMPLSVSYRCPSAVVELAKQVNPGISAAANAKTGTIEKIKKDELYSRTVKGDVIISRTNYPLVKAWFHYIKAGIKANMMNRDFGDKLIWRINGWQPRDKADLINKIENWKDVSTNRLSELKKSYKHITDEYDCLMAFVNSEMTLMGILRNIFSFFDYNEDTQISLLTAHKSKGLEFNRTYVLMDTFSFGDTEEENNVWYVAITRTKDYLGLVSND